MTPTQVYSFDAQTGEYKSKQDALFNPLDNEPLLPAHATFLPPPFLDALFTDKAVFEDGKWQTKEDHRGAAYIKETGELVHVSKLGKLDSSLTPLPPQPNSKWNKQTNSWIKKNLTLVQTKKQKVKELNIETKKKILAGFVANTLGEANIYPSKEEDQRNLTAMFVRGKEGDLWSQNVASKKWKRVTHTSDQVQEVAIIVMDGIQKALDDLNLATIKVSNSSSIKEVKKIKLL